MCLEVGQLSLLCRSILTFFTDPKSRALDETSLTLLDVRAAVEWVSENIELFGGDKNNIMVNRAFESPIEAFVDTQL